MFILHQEALFFYVCFLRSCACKLFFCLRKTAVYFSNFFYARSNRLFRQSQTDTVCMSLSSLFKEHIIPARDHAVIKFARFVGAAACVHSARGVSSAQMALSQIDAEDVAYLFPERPVQSGEPFRILMYRRFAHAEMFGARPHGAFCAHDVLSARNGTLCNALPHRHSPADSHW